MTLHLHPRTDGTVISCVMPGGTRLSTLVIGSGGQPALFIHGLGGAPDQYAPTLRRLAERYDLRIYALWLPNHGPSCDLHTYDEVIAAVAEWAGHFALPGPVPVFGHSIGGYMALDLAIRRSELVSAVVTIAPPVGAPHNRRPLSYWFIVPRVSFLATEALAITAVSGLVALWNGGWWDHSLAVAHYLRHLPRLHWAVKVVHEAPDLLPELAALVEHQGITPVHLFGAWDLVVPPPRRALPGRTMIVPYGLHCCLLAPWSAAPEAVLDAAGVALGHPRVVPRPRQRTVPRALPAPA